MARGVVGRAAQLEPVPVEGCGPCGTPAEAREIARKAGDLRAVDECSGRISEHPPPESGCHVPRPFLGSSA